MAVLIMALSCIFVLFCIVAFLPTRHPVLCPTFCFEWCFILFIYFWFILSSCIIWQQLWLLNMDANVLNYIQYKYVWTVENMFPWYCTNMISNKTNPFIAPKFSYRFAFLRPCFTHLSCKCDCFYILSFKWWFRWNPHTWKHRNRHLIHLFMSIINEDKAFSKFSHFDWWPSWIWSFYGHQVKNWAWHYI